MMSVKGGTQTWSSAPQQTERKTEGAERISAADKEKYFDSEELGETLNKVADPNFVASKAPRKVGNNELGKDAFMTLLLTQMKNQDPTNPLKSHEMAAQLAQFTSLEKLNNINEGINNLRKDQLPDHNFQALNMIGKTITMDNSKIARTDANASHELRFTLPSDAVKAKIEVRDPNGNTVRILEMHNLKTGVNSVSWNGKTEDGATASTGDFTMSVEAQGSNGNKIYVQTKAEGRVTGVNFTAQGPQLLMGTQTISMADVKSISDPEEQQQLAPPDHVVTPVESNTQAPAMAMPTPQRTMKADASKNTKQVDPKLKKGNINDFAMTQDFVNKLNKQGIKAGMDGT
jgi:flagellar basal-body rod modification protein FlgD